MTTTDKVKVIAEYDGWVDDMHNMYVNPNYNKGTLMYLSDMPYLTSLDWLHPVALNVLNHLVSEFNISTKFNTYVCASDHIDTIKISIYKPPISGEYIDLFNAVYDGIVFLNSNK